MTTLATRLPYSHPFAGGYPRIGGQALPTDPDAIDYLQRQAAVDGPVEVGVAMAVDAFVKGCKSDSAGYAGDPTRTLWDALQACCIMAGARTISGALVPLKGAAPTPYNLTNFDYARSTGIKGDGSSTYLDSGRLDSADTPSDAHLAVYASSLDTKSPAGFYIGAESTNPFDIYQISGVLHLRNGVDATDSHTAGLLAHSYSSGSLATITGGATNENAGASRAATSGVNVFVFGRNSATPYLSNARLAFYSIGSSLSLSNLDTRVSTLISSISTALS